MKSYLVYGRRVAFDRVISVVAGKGEALRVDVWLAPHGTPAPVDEATRRAGEVLAKRPRRRPGDCGDIYDRI